MKFMILSILLIGTISAWNGETHLLIARMAYDILKKDDPTTLAKAEALLRKYSDKLTKEHENMYPFVECVTLPDDNKRVGGGYQSNWHFDDMPIIGDNSKASDLQIEHNEKNITTVMPQLYDWLMGKNVEDTLAYTTVMAHTNSEEEGRSMALRLLIHYMGDIHQPLHCSNRYTADLPKGDRGGNDFLLKSHDKAKELHAVWDSVVYAYHKNPKRPFTKDTFTF